MSLRKAMPLFCSSAYPLIHFLEVIPLWLIHMTSAARHELFPKFLLSIHLFFVMGDARVHCLLASSPIQQVCSHTSKSTQHFLARSRKPRY